MIMPADPADRRPRPRCLRRRIQLRPVIPELLADGLPVVVPAVPKRSLAGDGGYIASVIRQIDGPVILVGHSYGGAVITVAGVEDNVQALVYLSAYALDEGESLGELQGRFPDSPSPTPSSTPPSRSTAPRDRHRCHVDVGKFPGIFAADVDPELAKTLAVVAAAPRWRRLLREGHRRGVEDQAGLGLRRHQRPHHQPRRRALRLPAGRHDGHRDRLIPPGHALAPQGSRRPHPHRHRRQLVGRYGRFRPAETTMCVRLDAARRQPAPDPRARKALVARRRGGRPVPFCVDSDEEHL